MAEILEGASITANEVREIYSTELTDPQLANFINMAYLATKNLGLSDEDVLKYLQLLLSAHYATVYDGIVQSQSIAGEYSVTYGLVLGEGLKASPFGLQALTLDTSGKLAKLDLKRAIFQVSSQYDVFSSTYLQEKIDG